MSRDAPSPNYLSRLDGVLERVQELQKKVDAQAFQRLSSDEPVRVLPDDGPFIPLEAPMTLAEEDVEATVSGVGQSFLFWEKLGTPPSEHHDERIALTKRIISTFLDLQAKKGLVLLPREAPRP